MVNIQFKLGTLRKRKRLQTPSGPYPGAPAQPLRLRRRLPGDGAGGPPARTRIAPAWAAMSAMFHAGPGRLAPNQHLAARPRRTPGQPGPAQPARPGPAGPARPSRLPFEVGRNLPLVAAAGRRAPILWPGPPSEPPLWGSIESLSTCCPVPAPSHTAATTCSSSTDILPSR